MMMVELSHYIRSSSEEADHFTVCPETVPAMTSTPRIMNATYHPVESRMQELDLGLDGRYEWISDEAAIQPFLFEKS